MKLLPCEFLSFELPLSSSPKEQRASLILIPSDAVLFVAAALTVANEGCGRMPHILIDRRGPELRREEAGEEDLREDSKDDAHHPVCRRRETRENGLWNTMIAAAALLT